MLTTSCDSRRSPLRLMRALVCAVLAAWLSSPSVVSAKSGVTGLNSAEVPVEGRQTEQRGRAIVEAFGEVLVKITGHRGIAGRQELVGDLKGASRYVQQYRYIGVPGEGGDAASLLRVTFDEQAVTRLLHERGLPVWGGIRPSVLVWLGLDEQGRRTLYLGEGNEGPRRAMEQVAEDRGLPLLFPLLDLEDQSQLQASDLWGGFENRIRAASERYGADAILAGRLSSKGGRWRGAWTLYQADRQDSFEEVAGSQEQAVSAGGQWVADVLAARYAPLGADQTVRRLRLRVAGIEDLESYGRLSSFLGSLDAVDRLSLVLVEPTASTFELSVSGGSEALERALVLGGRLEPEAGGMPAGPAAGVAPQLPPEVTTLYYRFRP